MVLEEVRKQFSKQYALYTYNISNLNASKKVRFVYLLKGRAKDSGLVEELKGRFLANGCFIVPIDKDKEMQEVFKQWDIKFERMEVLIH